MDTGEKKGEGSMKKKRSGWRRLKPKELGLT